MLSYRDNVKAILECNFSGFKDSIIDNACNRICELLPKVVLIKPDKLKELKELINNGVLTVLTEEPKTGCWIEHKNQNGIDYIECSECSCWFLRMHMTRNSYCPNCGMKMIWR